MGRLPAHLLRLELVTPDGDGRKMRRVALALQEGEAFHVRGPSALTRSDPLVLFKSGPRADLSSRSSHHHRLSGVIHAIVVASSTPQACLR